MISSFSSLNPYTESHSVPCIKFLINAVKINKYAVNSTCLNGIILLSLSPLPENNLIKPLVLALLARECLSKSRLRLKLLQKFKHSEWISKEMVIFSVIYFYIRLPLKWIYKSWGLAVYLSRITKQNWIHRLTQRRVSPEVTVLSNFKVQCFLSFCFCFFFCEHTSQI